MLTVLGAPAGAVSCGLVSTHCVIIPDSGASGRGLLVMGLQGTERAARTDLPGAGVPGQHLPAGP